MTNRPFRAIALVTAGAAGLLGTAACGSSGSSQAGPTTAVTQPATTTSTTAPPLAAQADALCAEASAARNDVAHLDLTKPASVSAAAGTVSADLAKLQSTLSSVSNAGASGARSGPVQTLTADVRQALATGQQAITAMAAGKVSGAQADVQQAIADLKAATAAGQDAGLHCGSASAGSTANGSVPSTTTAPGTGTPSGG